MHANCPTNLSLLDVIALEINCSAKNICSGDFIVHFLIF
jgi:hypothetical protein